MRMLISAFLLLVILLSAATVVAGELSPPPGPPAPTMKTLEEVYNQAAQANDAAGNGRTLLVYPYVLERYGKASDTTYTFDTTFDFMLTAPFTQGTKDAKTPKAIDPVAINLYLFSNNGQVGTALGGTQIANPATFILDAATPHLTVILEDLIAAKGGFASQVFVGFAVLAISSGNWNDVAVDAKVINAHTSATDLSITPLTPTRVPDLTGAKEVPATKPAEKK